MSAWPIAFVGLIYAGIACEQFYRGNFPMAITFGGYSVSNVGLYWLAKL